jgi:hypothetical protein
MGTALFQCKILRWGCKVPAAALSNRRGAGVKFQRVGVSNTSGIFKCKELISSSVNGNKEEKQAIIRDLLRMLWVGNADEAIEYLNSLDRKIIKSDRWFGELTGYLERKRPQIACYALRDGLGLRNSSNRVEKANDLLVAGRQKHNGMSWSREGSGALAAISMILSNNETEQWLYTRTLSFSLPANVAA